MLMQKNIDYNKGSGSFNSYNRDEMQKQIENLNRHVFNTTKNQESLE